MADFHQTGVISTLHRLGRPDLDRLERDLRAHARARPIALVLPCLYSELHDGALKNLIDELTRVTYLAQVIVSVAGTDRPSEFNEMRDAFAPVRTRSGAPPTLIWEGGPHQRGRRDARSAEDPEAERRCGRHTATYLAR